MRIAGFDGFSGRVQRFGIFAVEFLFGVFLMFAEEFGVETDVTGFVYAMDVTETCCDGEVRSHFCECRVYIPDIFRLSIQRSIIHASVINP